MFGASHIKRIKRNAFNKELCHGKVFFRSFNGANAKQLRHDRWQTRCNCYPHRY